MKPQGDERLRVVAREARRVRGSPSQAQQGPPLHHVHSRKFKVSVRMTLIGEDEDGAVITPEGVGGGGHRGSLGGDGDSGLHLPQWVAK